MVQANALGFGVDLILSKVVSLSLSLSESLFILNLAMLAVESLYVLSAKGDQAATTYTSIGIICFQFIRYVV